MSTFHRLRSRKGERGVALLMVVAAVAILTAVAVEFSYHSRVEARLAANARDELRAYYLARSAVQMTRLVLHFQKQVDSIQLPDISSLLKGLGGGSSGGLGAMGNVGALGIDGGVSSGGGASSSLHLRLWDIIPVDSGTLQMFMGAPKGFDADTNAASLASLAADGGLNVPTVKGQPKNAKIGSVRPFGGTGGSLPGGQIGPEARGGVSSKLLVPTRPFGDFDGTFHSEVTDEESKINVNALNQLSTQAAATTTEMLALMHYKDQKYDFLFDDNLDSDPQHRQIHREDVLVNLHDFVDTDNATVAFNPLALAVFSDPFTQGYGDEDDFYQRQEPRYRAKNAPIDTVDELYQVHGVTEKFMQAFGDKLTVYSSPSGLLNINTNDPDQQLTNIMVALDTNRFPEAPLQLIGNPILLQTVLAELQLLRTFAFVGISVQSFLSVLSANQLPVRPELLVPNGPHAFLGDTSQTFTIHASGEVGDVQSRISAVVRYDDNLGKILYWKEE